MSLSMYQASVPVFKRALNNLSHILTKGEEHTGDKQKLLSMCLAPDMYPLTRQVQIASDAVKGGAARLAGVDAPSFPDTETTFEALHARITSTIAFIDTISAAQIDGSEDKSIVLKLPSRELNFTGQSFLFSFVLPNVFFHVTTAYAIMRHAGVPLGKMDYLGNA